MATVSKPAARPAPTRARETRRDAAPSTNGAPSTASTQSARLAAERAAAGNAPGIATAQGGFAASDVQNGTRAITGAANPLQNVTTQTTPNVTAPTLTQGLANTAPSAPGADAPGAPASAAGAPASAAASSALAATIGPKSEALGQLDQRIDELTTRRAELTEELSGIELSRSERFLGGVFAGAFGGDTSNLERQDEILTERSAVGWDLREAQNERRALNSEINNDVAGHLEQSGDPTFQALQANVDRTRNVKDAVEDFAGNLERTVLRADETIGHANALRERETTSPDRQSFEARNYSQAQHRVAETQLDMALRESHTGFDRAQDALAQSNLQAMDPVNPATNSDPFRQPPETGAVNPRPIQNIFNPMLSADRNPVERLVRNYNTPPTEIARTLRPLLHEARLAAQAVAAPYFAATSAQEAYVAEQRASAVAEFIGQ